MLVNQSAWIHEMSFARLFEFRAFLHQLMLSITFCTDFALQHISMLHNWQCFTDQYCNLNKLNNL